VVFTEFWHGWTLNHDLAKTFEDRHLDTILDSISPLLTDPDRFKQRAGAEVLVGLLRGMAFSVWLLDCAENHRLGSKHWPKQKWDKLWTWTLDRIDQIFVQIKPDTLSFWKSVFSVSVLCYLGPRLVPDNQCFSLNWTTEIQGGATSSFSGLSTYPLTSKGTPRLPVSESEERMPCEMLKLFK